MRRILRKLYRFSFRNRFVTPLVELWPINIPRYAAFLVDYLVYRRMQGNEKSHMLLWPQLNEKTPKTAIDPHYFYQGIWAADKVSALKPAEHVDVGSQADLIGFLTTVTKVKFVDLRPLPVQLANLQNIKGDILRMPFANDSVPSLSCLHVAEHVGLGRYGDRLDPQGTRKACAELARVLAPGGHLYFSIPVGQPRTYFNAHRVHAPETIREYFPGLVLIEFSAVDDKGRMIRTANMEQLRHASYGCGLFHFTKPDQAAPKNILVIKTGAAGDVIRTTSLLPGLKEKYPGTSVDWLTKKSMEPFLRGNRHIDRILYVDEPQVWNKNSYELVLSLEEDEDACRIASTITKNRLVGAHLQDGKPTYTAETAAWFDMSLISQHGKATADVLKTKNRKTYQEICYEMLDMPYRKQEPHVPLSPEDTAFATQFAHANGITFRDLVIGINPGSGKRWWDKRLPPADVEKLAQGIRRKYPASKILLLGGPEEREYNQEIIGIVRKFGVVDAGCDNDLGRFAALVNLCHMVVTSDSLALHVATGLKKKTIAFFGPTSPWEIELYEHGVKILPVRGCLSCYKPRCEITPEFDVDMMVKHL
jgi:ADP-heptose:LPS heptosyltransferase